MSHDSTQGTFVDYPGNPEGPSRAKLLIEAGDATLRQAVVTRSAAALLFEQGDPTRPLLVGLEQPLGARNARVDGERVVLTGEHEIELRCGDASILLTKNGKLVIRGAYVETRAKGTNRIKGGSVQIN